MPIISLLIEIFVSYHFLKSTLWHGIVVVSFRCVYVSVCVCACEGEGVCVHMCVKLNMCFSAALIWRQNPTQFSVLFSHTKILHIIAVIYRPSTVCPHTRNLTSSIFTTYIYCVLLDFFYTAVTEPLVALYMPSNRLSNLNENILMSRSNFIILIFTSI